MPMLTLNAKVIAGEQTQAVLLDAMHCATKVYNACGEVSGLAHPPGMAYGPRN